DGGFHFRFPPVGKAVIPVKGSVCNRADAASRKGYKCQVKIEIEIGGLTQTQSAEHARPKGDGRQFECLCIIIVVVLKSTYEHVQPAELVSSSEQGAVSRDIIHYFSPHAEIHLGSEFEVIERFYRTAFERVAVIELDIHHLVGVSGEQGIRFVVDGVGAEEQGDIYRLFLIDLFIDASFITPVP